MTVTIETNNRTVHLRDVLTIERETYFDARSNKQEVTYYITTNAYEYMYFDTYNEQISSILIEMR